MGLGDWNPFKKLSVNTELLKEDDPSELLETLPGDLPSKTEDVNEMMTIIANFGGVEALSILNKMYPKGELTKIVDHLAYNIASQSDAPTRDAVEIKSAVSDWMNERYYYDDWEKKKGTSYSGLFKGVGEHYVDYDSPNIIAQYLGLEDINYPIVSGPSKKITDYVGNLSKEQIESTWYSMEEFRSDLGGLNFIDTFIERAKDLEYFNLDAIKYDIKTLKETGFLNLSNYYTDEKREEDLYDQWEEGTGTRGLLPLRDAYQTRADLANYTTVLEYDKETGKGIIHAYDIWDFGSSYSDKWVTDEGKGLQEQFMSAVGIPINFYDQIEIPKEQMDKIFQAGEW